MRKLMLVFVAMLTTATPALASGGPALPVPAPEADPGTAGPEADLTSDRQIQQRVVERRSDREVRNDVRRHREKKRQAAANAPVAVSPALQAIAQCESGGDPAAIGGGGAFRGKYQFTFETWAAVGGSGDPANAPEAEQDRRAAALYSQSGPGQWPVCGG